MKKKRSKFLLREALQALRHLSSPPRRLESEDGDLILTDHCHFSSNYGPDGEILIFAYAGMERTVIAAVKGKKPAKKLMHALSWHLENGKNFITWEALMMSAFGSPSHESIIPLGRSRKESDKEAVEQLLQEVNRRNSSQTQDDGDGSEEDELHG